MQHLRGRIAKSDVRTTYHVRTYASSTVSRHFGAETKRPKLSYGKNKCSSRRSVQLLRPDVRAIDVQSSEYQAHSQFPLCIVAHIFCRLLDLRVSEALILYFHAVLLLLKVLHISISLQHLHRWLLQGMLPFGVGGAA